TAPQLKAPSAATALIGTTARMINSAKPASTISAGKPFACVRVGSTKSLSRAAKIGITAKIAASKKQRINNKTGTSPPMYSIPIQVKTTANTPQTAQESLDFALS